VLAQAGAGLASSLPDDDYRGAGAEIVATAAECGSAATWS